MKKQSSGQSHTSREGDLLKSSPAYEAHASQIAELMREVDDSKDLVQSALEAGASRMTGNMRGRMAVHDRNLPTLDSVERPEHINCAAVRALYHNAAMEVFRRDNDDKYVADLRPILEKVASLRLSLLNFDVLQKPTDYVGTIQETDRLVRPLMPNEEVPSMVPYLFTPNSALSTLKQKTSTERFADPDIMLNLGEMFTADTHVLHSVCMSLATQGMPEHIEHVLDYRAKMEFGPLGPHALLGLLQQHPDLFVAHVVGLTESGRTEDAIKWCERQTQKGLIETHGDLALKYVTSLRNTGQFERAKAFCLEHRDNPAFDGKKFAMQYKMALAECRDLLPMKLSEFQLKYPDFA